MKHVVTLFIFIIYCLPTFAQNDIASEIKKLIDDEQYDKIIKQHSNDSKDYSAKSLYYIGFASYMTEDDNKCVKYMNLSIEKDSLDPAPFYIKASSLNYLERYNEAVKNFLIAIDLKSNDAEFYSGLGDSYYNLEKLDLSLKAFQKAIEQVNCPDRPYSLIAQIYSEQRENDKALEAFYIAKSKISEESISYINALFNIGLLESLKNNYEKAELAFVELLQLDPTDYHTYAKLIQIYYARKEYDKADPYKKKLYGAHKKGLLNGNLEDMYCFDQFKWNGYLIQAFERYENENKGDIYNKHIFYVLDSTNNITLSVQTEFSPISMELGGPKYLLCANKDAVHYNPGIGFNADFQYENLKLEAIKLFEKYIK